MELFNKYPFYKEELVKRTIRYDDDLKIFLESALKTIEYFDKVPDEIDFCPNTPIGEPVDANGCSKSQKIKDLDLDGVPNEEDRCPDTPFGDPVNQYGCSPKQVSQDRDMDGVLDEFDLCPKTNLEERIINEQFIY